MAWVTPGLFCYMTNVLKYIWNLIRGSNNSIIDSALTYQEQIFKQQADLLNKVTTERNELQQVLSGIQKDLLDQTSKLNQLSAELNSVNAKLDDTIDLNKFLLEKSCTVLCKNRIRYELPTTKEK